MIDPRTRAYVETFQEMLAIGPKEWMELEVSKTAGLMVLELCDDGDNEWRKIKSLREQLAARQLAHSELVDAMGAGWVKVRILSREYVAGFEFKYYGDQDKVLKFVRTKLPPEARDRPVDESALAITHVRITDYGRERGSRSYLLDSPDCLRCLARPVYSPPGGPFLLSNQ